MGGRSVGFSRANRYGARFQEHVETANAGTVVVAQVEHIDGVRAIESILGVAGVDAVFIGPYDLSASLGKPGRIEDPDVREAIRTVASACAAKKVPVGIFALGIPGFRQGPRGRLHARLLGDRHRPLLPVRRRHRQGAQAKKSLTAPAVIY